MNETKYFSNQHIQGLVHEIIRGIHKDQWYPDYIVGITRGGLVPAVMLSHYLGVPMNTLKVSSRDDDSCESNLWMAEDAYGYMPGIESGPGNSDPMIRKNILIVDDINDTGDTFSWIKKDWQSGCLPHDSTWDSIWGNNVRFAVLVDNESSKFENISYSGISINKLEQPTWCIFPWEEWWYHDSK